MGLLSEGETLEWVEIKPLVEKLKWAGIEQFINLYHQLKNRENDCLRWGDEIEYTLVKFDHENRRATLALRAHEILDQLKVKEEKEKKDFQWAPEFASFQIEGTPGKPFTGDFMSFCKVEENMRLRRNETNKILDENETVMTIPCFPRLGCPNFTSPPATPNPHGDYSRSIFFPQEAVSDFFPRFKVVDVAVRQRRGSNVIIHVPIFRDEKTPRPFRENFSDENAKKYAKDDHIYMDATGCGCGCCGLQVTFQAANETEARYLYDNLTPITPIMMALTAGSPIYRGYLTSWDCRWNVITRAADDRNEEERGLRPLNEQKFQIPKSRDGTLDCYLHPDSTDYNDINVLYHKEHYNRLIEAGIDAPLAQHVAHLFIRDPLQVFRENVDKLENSDDWKKESDFFEDIQSTNWNNMRYKPPPLDQSEIGWRVEFRTMEVQLTDFENAAYVSFIVLLTRVILSSRLSFLIPISKVDENMKRAAKKDAVLNEKFWFRYAKAAQSKNQSVTGPDSEMNGFPESDIVPETSVEEMSINEIINGKGDDFAGLVPLVQRYLDSVEIDLETRQKIDQYLNLIQKRASGQFWTLARFMREFVQRHPDYKKDSVVNEKICYDLMNTMNEIALGHAQCEKLNGIERQSECDTCLENGKI